MPGVLIAIIVIAILFGLYFAYDRRYHGRETPTHPPEAFRPTDEVFRDPGSNALIRVYENPATGERQYRPEP
ncbi:MAG: hypothetical protein ACRD2H_03175 [Terriglobales bacterium]